MFIFDKFVCRFWYYCSYCGEVLNFIKSYDGGITDAFKTALILGLAGARVAGAYRKFYQFVDPDVYLGVYDDVPSDRFYSHGKVFLKNLIKIFDQ